MYVPRTDGTGRLKPFSRQFFQWYYIDSYTLPRVVELFLILFRYLLEYGDGISRHATLNQWRGRRLEWNKIWNIPGRKRGPSLATPPELSCFPLWFEGVEFAKGAQPYKTTGGEAPNPFQITIPRPDAVVLNNSTNKTQQDWNAEELPGIHNELPPVFQSLNSPSRLDDPFSGHFTCVHQLSDTGTDYQQPSNPPLEGMDWEIYPPMLPNACPRADEYWFYRPSLWDATTTTQASDNFQPHPSSLLPMAPDSFRAPAEPAVAGFYSCLPRHSNGSQTQPQNNDVDLLTNTTVLSHSYDPWPGELSYDGLLSRHRPEH